VPAADADTCSRRIHPPLPQTAGVPLRPREELPRLAVDRLSRRHSPGASSGRATARSPRTRSKPSRRPTASPSDRGGNTGACCSPVCSDRPGRLPAQTWQIFCKVAVENRPGIEWPAFDVTPTRCILARGRVLARLRQELADLGNVRDFRGQVRRRVSILGSSIPGFRLPLHRGPALKDPAPALRGEGGNREHHMTATFSQADLEQMEKLLAGPASGGRDRTASPSSTPTTAAGWASWPRRWLLRRTRCSSRWKHPGDGRSTADLLVSRLMTRLQNRRTGSRLRREPRDHRPDDERLDRGTTDPEHFEYFRVRKILGEGAWARCTSADDTRLGRPSP